MTSRDGQLSRLVNAGRSTLEPDHSSMYALFDMVRSHAERESAIIDSYQHLVENTENEGLRYLVRLIVEDEVRHHQQISEMLNEMHSFVSGVDIEPRLPNLGLRHDAALRHETDRLLAIEKEDAIGLKRLRKELRADNGYALFTLLVRLMMHDTAKHIAILQFIR